MTNDIIFSKSFAFNNFHFKNYKYTDKRSGTDIHYFAYMVRGCAKICTQESSVSISEGDIFFIPKGCKYQSYWYGNTDIEFISLGFLLLPNFEGRYYAPQVIDCSDEAVRLMYDIGSCTAVSGITVGKLYTLVGMLMQNMAYQPTSRHAELINKVRELIEEDPTITVSDIAKRCAVSESALYTLFKNHSDKSIGETKREVIMEKAKSLLLSCDHPIEQLSRTLGFSSGAYFRKCFKEHFGISPREMRKNLSI